MSEAGKTTRDDGLTAVKWLDEPKSGTRATQTHRSVVLWMRLAELGASVACFLAALLFSTLYDLSPSQIGHLWMLNIGSEEAWIGCFAALGFVLLVGALSTHRVLRGACLGVAITFYGGVSVAALKAHAMPISVSFFLATTLVLSATFLAGPRRVPGSG